MLVEYASHHIQQEAPPNPVRHQRHHRQDRHGHHEAIAGGERDPRKLARCAIPGSDEATIAKSPGSLTHLRTDPGPGTVGIRDDCPATGRLKPGWKFRSDGEPPAPNGKKRNQKNAPRFDVQSPLYRMTGVDLTRIDGVDGFTALKVVSRQGMEMGERQTLRMGLSPNNRITGGKVMSSKTKPSANRAAFSGSQRAAPLGQRPGRLPAPKESPPGSAQGHHGEAHKLGHLLHAAVRPAYVHAGENTTRVSISRACALHAWLPVGDIRWIGCPPRIRGPAP